MVPGSGINASIPLPEFRPPYGPDVSHKVRLRNFAVIEDDLGIDFSTRNRAALATRLLELCAVDPDGILPSGFFRELSAGKRIECLLVLAMCGSGQLTLPFKCSVCNEELEIELSLDEIYEIQRAADSTDTVEVVLSGRRMRLRKCSGRDQDIWFERVFADEHDAAVTMIDTLSVDALPMPSISLADVEAIEEALDAADPLVNLSFDVSCTACGRSNECNVDLFETALGMLDHAQRRLIVNVHKLASAYNWSEREIFAVPEWRRQKYLNLIAGTK